MKYSGRVAEGIRGNSGERSSEEFEETLENEVRKSLYGNTWRVEIITRGGLK
jgi:hypothetical protein